MTQQQRDSIALTKIEQFLDNQIDDEDSPLDRKLVAAKIRYDKLRPALSAVEQTNVNEGETLTEEQILLKLQQVIDAHPEVVAKMLQAKQSKPDQAQDCGVNTESAPQHADGGSITSNSNTVTH